MVTRECEQCGSEFETYPSFIKNGGGRFCSRSCKSKHQWDARRSDTGYRREARPGHPIADASGIVYVHRAVLFDKIGRGPHACHWCGTAVEWKQYAGGKQAGVLVSDHVDGDQQNNDPSNLVPSCFNCNKNRLVRPRKAQLNAVRDDELFVLDRHGWRHRAEERHCAVCGAKFLALLKSPSTRRFCSQTCVGVAKRKS